MANNSKRPVAQIGMTGEVISTYPTATAAATALNLTKNSDCNIIKACNGVRLSAYGYKWKFSEEQVDTEHNEETHFYLYTFSVPFEELTQKIELEIIRLKVIQDEGKSNQQSITRLLPKYEYLPHLLIVNMLNG